MGTCSIVFLICYGVFRVISEFFRQPDVQLAFNAISMGTLLSSLMILIGLFLFYILKKKT